MDRVEHGWVGIDAGRGHHHVVVVDQEGRALLSSRVANDEPDLIAVIQKIRDHVRHPRWAIDLADGAGALMVALLLRRDQAVFYLPGIASTGHLLATAVRARPTPKTPRSSPIKLGCAVTCAGFSCSTTTLCSCN
jgi:transposase